MNLLIVGCTTDVTKSRGQRKKTYLKLNVYRKEICNKQIFGDKCGLKSKNRYKMSRIYGHIPREIL